MSITLSSVAQLPYIEGLEITPAAIPEYTTNVQIFRNTRAVEIPDRLNAVAQDLKDFSNAVAEDETNHVNTSFEALTEYVSETMAGVRTHVNTEVVAKVNTMLDKVETDQNSFQTSITNQQTTYESAETAARLAFQNSVTDNLGHYVNDTDGIVYSTDQVNSLHFSGTFDAGGITRDSDGRIASISTESKTTTEIVYNDNGQLSEWKETLIVDGASYSKKFKATYSTFGEIIKIEEIVEE